MTDDEIEERLVDRGVAPDLAERVVTFVPMAFAVDADALAGSAVAGHFTIDLPSARTARVPMMREAVFAAALERARELRGTASHTAIGRRSPLSRTASADEGDDGSRRLAAPRVWPSDPVHAARFADDTDDAGGAAPSDDRRTKRTNILQRLRGLWRRDRRQR